MKYTILHSLSYAYDSPVRSSTQYLRLTPRDTARQKVLGWKLGGRTWPHPFFDRATRAPSRPLTTLTPAEREALRSLCGPRPAS